MELNIERIESGPAWMDKASIHSESDATSYIEMQNGFAAAVRAGDANAMAPWAPRITDWDAMKRAPREIGQTAPRRHQTLAECMAEALDYSDGPSMTEAMQLLVNASKSTDNTLAQQASHLLGRMGISFAFHNT